MLEPIARGLGFMPAAVVLVQLTWIVKANGARPLRAPRIQPLGRIPWSTTLLLVLAASLLSGVGVAVWYSFSEPVAVAQAVLLMTLFAALITAPLWLVIMLLARRIERLRREGVIS